MYECFWLRSSDLKLSMGVALAFPIISHWHSHVQQVMPAVRKRPAAAYNPKPENRKQPQARKVVCKPVVRKSRAMAEKKKYIKNVRRMKSRVSKGCEMKKRGVGKRLPAGVAEAMKESKNAVAMAIGAKKSSKAAETMAADAQKSANAAETTAAETKETADGANKTAQSAVTTSDETKRVLQNVEAQGAETISLFLAQRAENKIDVEKLNKRLSIAEMSCLCTGLSSTLSE